MTLPPRLTAPLSAAMLINWFGHYNITLPTRNATDLAYLFNRILARSNPTTIQQARNILAGTDTSILDAKKAFICALASTATNDAQAVIEKWKETTLQVTELAGVAAVLDAILWTDAINELFTFDPYPWPINSTELDQFSNDYCLTCDVISGGEPPEGSSCIMVTSLFAESGGNQFIPDEGGVLAYTPGQYIKIEEGPTSATVKIFNGLTLVATLTGVLSQTEWYVVPAGHTADEITITAVNYDSVQTPRMKVQICTPP